jgi:ribose/xylose/arabinose/galactoside ABC-type transport system permease subunit
VAGVILGAPTLRLRGDYLAIVTLGFGEIIRITARNLDNVTNGATGIAGVPVPPGPEIDGRAFFNTSDAERWYWLALVVLLLMIFMARRLENSRVGRAWLAIREDEDAAAVMGVAAFKYKLWAFAIGATLGASRSALRFQAAVRRAQRVHGDAVVPVRGHGRHRWVRQHLRRPAGRVPADLPARAVPRVPGVAPVRVRAGARPR